MARRAALVPLVTVILFVAQIVLVPPLTAAAWEVRQPPSVTADALYVTDIDAGVELYKLNDREPLPPASLTKIATAMLLVRNVADLGENVTIEAGDLAGEGESTMALQAGDVVTFTDLLYGLLLPSGNDAANAVARVIGERLLAREGAGGDPLARFVEEMNALADEFGLDQTHFENPTGLHQQGHLSSARDLAILARRTFTHRAIRDVIRAASYVVNYQGSNPRQARIETTVVLKKEGDETVIGGKTGTTPEAGACLILMTEAHGGNRVITVILGSDVEFTPEGDRVDETDRRYEDARAVLTSLDQDYLWLDIANEREVPGLHEELSVWQVGLKSDHAIVVPRTGNVSVTYLLQLGPEAEPEVEVGRVLFFVAAEQVAERPVIQLAPASDASLLTAA